MSVRKNATTGNMEVAPCKVYRITAINNDDNTNAGDGDCGGGYHHAVETCGPSGLSLLFPEGNESVSSSKAVVDSPHNVCLVVVDLTRRRASVLRKKFVPFW